MTTPIANVTSYSRQNPSPRYRKLVAFYQQMHVEGIPALEIEAPRLYIGASLVPHLPKIKMLVAQTQSISLLDYGAGKGLVYRKRNIKLRTGEKIPTVRDYLGVVCIVCYDPAVKEHMELPNERFDGVVSTDVLEHCPEEDIPWIIEELFAKAMKFVFANIACFPAGKTLPNGENAHCTIRPPAWWREIISPIAARYPGIISHFEISESYQN